jgi:hypothetical protein
LLPQASQEATFHIDHIKPLAEGGTSHPDNLALACVSCSLKKSARVKHVDPRTGKSVRLFNPRLDKWAEHLKLTLHLKISGRTAVGRATVSALDMNRPTILLIRRELQLLGRFPA